MCVLWDIRICIINEWYTFGAKYSTIWGKLFIGKPQDKIRTFTAQSQTSGIYTTTSKSWQLVQQQRDQIFEIPKPAVQHLSTYPKLFPGISGYRIWLMTLPEMGAGWEFDIFYTYPIFRENILLNMIFASFALYHNVGPVKSNVVGLFFSILQVRYLWKKNSTK